MARKKSKELAVPREFDVSTLKRGDFLPPETLEQLFGVTRDKSRFGIKKLQLAAEIEKASTAAGDPVYAKGEGHGLRILSDSEASEYHAGRFDAHIRGATRSRVRHSRVDTRALTVEQRARHADQQCLMGRVEMSVKAELAKAQKRPGPAILPQNDD